MPITLGRLAELIGGSLAGDPRTEIRAVAPIESAGPGDVTFVANKRYERHLASTGATAVILDDTVAVPRADLAVIRTSNPYYGFLLALRQFHPAAPPPPGVHPAAVVHPGARVDPSARIGACAVIGDGAAIGPRTDIGPCAVIGDGVRVGADCVVHANVTAIAGTRIGDRVVIHAGATIGSDGFGFVPVEHRFEKIPQVGGVVVEDDVEIGANCTVDRGTIGATVIRRGTKLDNLVHLAHNVVVGADSVIAAQSGVSGSASLGEHVMIGGQVGIVGHITVEDAVTIGAQSGVSKSITERGKIFRGSPAREIHEELKQEAAIRHLPELIASVRALEKRIEELEEAVRQAADSSAT